jgi:hypothetical protein
LDAKLISIESSFCGVSISVLVFRIKECGGELF